MNQLHAAVEILSIITVTHLKHRLQRSGLVVAQNIQDVAGTFDNSSVLDLQSVLPVNIIQSGNVTLAALAIPGNGCKLAVFVSIHQDLTVELDLECGSSGVHIRMVGIDNLFLAYINIDNLGKLV